MYYIETIWNSIYGFFWIKHSSFLEDWKILSYEMDKPFWQWYFKVYNANVYLKDKIIIYTKEIKWCKLEQYEWLNNTWIVCFEALELICNENWIDMGIKRLKHILTWIFIILIYGIIMIIIGFYIGYMWYTESPEDFIKNNPEIWQTK